MEKWKDIPEYEGVYQVSNLGQVRSRTRKVWNYMKPGRILKQHNNGTGYYYLSLSCDGKRAKHVYVHILVAKAFIDNPKGYTQVNHRDFNKANNCASNLEWVSPAQNIAHYRKSAYGKATEQGRQRCIRTKWVRRVLEHKDNIVALYEDGESIKNVARKSGVGKDFATDVLRLYGYLK